LRAYQIVFCGVIAIVGLAGNLIASAPADDGAAVAVFPPWWSAARAFAAAGGTAEILDGGAFPFVLIVKSQRPGLHARLRDAGALLILNPLGAGPCRQSSGEQNV